MPYEEWVGYVLSYDEGKGEASIHLDQGGLRIGERVHIRGHGADLRLTVDGLLLDDLPIRGARAGQDVGLRLDQPVPERADVFVVRR